jgi:fibronectin type 3 domain-containing protein
MALPTPDDAVGYNVYRATTHGGPYTKLTQSVTSASVYTDTTVNAGDTYYYVATSVDANNTESLPSDEASATVPID